ncbi:glycerol-3-phosphate acyltransferase [Halarsenatibacter silvermanii]|uniref:glycerol-3-phosphate acyltransferase n=1 Tax=Halarsenatibacter silvermanii TaxID=321763 RepID=UPI0013567038|nr:glycerol-3-phosphate acyltransferase [Halarsenatibacter silvermanii]
MNLILLLSALLGYVLGSFPSAVIFARQKGIEDIRKTGSGNMGTFNVLRTAGKGPAFKTLAADVLKGVGAAAAAYFIFSEAGKTSIYFAGMGAVLGHMFPVFAGFQGGKSLAAFSGVLLIISPALLAGILAAWILMYHIFNRIAVSSFIAFCLLPSLIEIIYAGAGERLIFLMAAGGFIGLRHRGDLSEDIKSLI